MKKETIKRKDQMRKNKSVQKLLFSFHTTIEQKGRTFHYDFWSFFFPFLFPPEKKPEEEKENE